MISGVEPRNLRKLVENGIQGVAELKQLYMEKLMCLADLEFDYTDLYYDSAKLLFFLYGCLNIFRLVSGLSWEPMVMWRALRHIKNTNYELQLRKLKVEGRSKVLGFQLWRKMRKVCRGFKTLLFSTSQCISCKHCDT
ncbi:hypothetical protein V6N13_122350 [Hibiscus sabdariffa]